MRSCDTVTLNYVVKSYCNAHQFTNRCEEDAIILWDGESNKHIQCKQEPIAEPTISPQSKEDQSRQFQLGITCRRRKESHSLPSLLDVFQCRCLSSTHQSFLSNMQRRRATKATRRPH